MKLKFTKLRAVTITAKLSTIRRISLSTMHFVIEAKNVASPYSRCLQMYGFIENSVKLFTQE
jgi:hypothetical protein